MMRKLTADFILNPNGQLLNKHTLVIEDDGKILDLVPSVFDEAEEFKGILSPGFINTHCHLELSHFKNKIHQHTGLDGFINEFVQTRKNAELSDLTSNEEANEYMWKSGIQAVGDICNNASTFVLKNKSAIRYHSFIEIFSMSASDAAITFREGLHLLNQGKASHTNASLVPHAPYSCTTNLFEFIQNFHNATNSKWCIHNQESSSENEMFLNASGKLLKMFSKKGIDMSWLIPSGTTSLQTISKHFPLTSNILLVHNTYTSLTDIQFLKKLNTLNRIWFSICPKANLFIENALPDMHMLHDQNCQLTVGTDSLASNDTLSILEELKVLHINFPKIAIKDLLTFATRNGAQYFGWDDLGTFTKKAKPGIINITHSNSETIEAKSEAIRVI